MKELSKFSPSAKPENVKTTDLMGFIAYAMADPRLSSPAKIVLSVVLARHFNRAKGVAWPSLDLLASETNFHRMTVSKAIRQLRKCGYLFIVTGTGRTSSRYGLGPQFRVSRSAYGYKPSGLPNQGTNPVEATNKPQGIELVASGREGAL